MRKGSIYTLLGFSVSFTVILGGWFWVRGLLQYKEEQLFAQNGQILVEAADYWKESAEAVTEHIFEGISLSEETMAKILTIWELGGREEYHEPLNGQMNMEQAMEAGKAWIKSMEEEKILSTDLSGQEFDSIHAGLCSPESPFLIDKELVSYWTITYKAADKRVVLKIHALTGQVWSADISYKSPGSLTEYGMDVLLGADDDEKLFQIAFPFLKGTSWMVKDSEVPGQGLLICEYEMVHAAINRYEMVTDVDDSMLGTVENHIQIRLYPNTFTNILNDSYGQSGL